MGIWIAILAFIVSIAALFFSYRRSVSDRNGDAAKIPEHIWDDLSGSIPEPDYNYLRATSDYMSASPGDMIARLNHIGATHEPSDPKQIRLTIVELRISEIEKKVLSLKKSVPSDLHIIWISLSAVATVSSLVALIFYLLQAGFLPLN